MPNRPKERRYTNWIDIGFTPLPPGWINVYRNGDGTHWTGPCPGVILQESTSETLLWDEPSADGKFTLCERRRETDRETRIVFAATHCYEDFDGPYPASDDSNYKMTTTPDYWEQIELERMSGVPK